MTATNASALNPYTFTITYSDNVAVAAVTLSGVVVQVLPPGSGAPITAIVESAVAVGTTDSIGDAKSFVVTYEITPPGGAGPQPMLATIPSLFRGAASPTWPATPWHRGPWGPFRFRSAGPSPSMKPTAASINAPTMPTALRRQHSSIVAAGCWIPTHTTRRASSLRTRPMKRMATFTSAFLMPTVPQRQHSRVVAACCLIPIHIMRRVSSLRTRPMKRMATFTSRIFNADGSSTATLKSSSGVLLDSYTYNASGQLTGHTTY